MLPCIFLGAPLKIKGAPGNIQGNSVHRIYQYIGPATAWWRHQMEVVSALLALCAGNSPVSDEFPGQRPVTRSFDVFFDLRLNKRLSKQSRGRWFETPSRSLLRHCNAMSRHVLFCFVCRQGEEWWRIRRVLSQRMLKPKLVSEFEGDLNHVLRDMVVRLRSIRDTEGHEHLTAALPNELYKWAFECESLHFNTETLLLIILSMVCKYDIKEVPDTSPICIFFKKKVHVGKYPMEVDKSRNGRAYIRHFICSKYWQHPVQDNLSLGAGKGRPP